MRNRSTGRYIVGDKAIASLSAAVAYAGYAAHDLPEPGTVYVREIGEPAAVARADKGPDGIVRLTVRKES